MVYLVDMGNVALRWVFYLQTATAEDEFVLFYSKNTTCSLTFPVVQMLFDSEAKIRCVPCYVGENAMDFQLCSELGFCIAGNKTAKYAIVSGDTGYDPVVKHWQDMGLPPIKVSVNMSQAQFIRTDVYASVTRALAETGLEPKYLEIEVTETMAVTDVDRTVDVLGKIHDLGVSISMDDFGTGYSSLASLKSIPFDVLKIDRSLVCDLSDNDTSRRITGAIVAMGKALRMIVLAEGVETNEQSKLLGEIGCDLAQGYYFSKPLPASEIETMLILPIGAKKKV